MGNMVMNEQDTPKQKLVRYVIGFVVVLYAAMLFGAAWVPECSLSEWFNNFYIFVFEQHHFIVGFTRETPMVIFLFEFVWTLAYLVDITNSNIHFQGVSMETQSGELQLTLQKSLAIMNKNIW